MTEEKSPDCCRRGFAASIKDTARRILENPATAPRKVVEDRLEICEACDHLSRAKICGMCQCYMPLKATMANLKCPIDKWVEISKND